MQVRMNYKRKFQSAVFAVIIILGVHCLWIIIAVLLLGILNIAGSILSAFVIAFFNLSIVHLYMRIALPIGLVCAIIGVIINIIKGRNINT